MSVDGSKFSRNARIRRRRMDRASTWDLAREFGISQPQVRRILAETGGDPLARGEDLAGATVAELHAERDDLKVRIADLRRRLRDVEDELGSRERDRLLGLSG